jgi:PPOX class probable FMN-dependent enzyme
MDGTTIDHTVRTEEELRALYPAVSPLAKVKAITRLDQHARRFIELSPLISLASVGASGAMDVTPRGDHPGFVQVLDETTVAIPDRPGNNRLDTLRNIIGNPNVALLFFVPGVDEMFRINGTGKITTDPALLATMVVNGKAPRSAILVHVVEAFFHCGKALKRSKLWDPAAQVPKGTVPSIARMIIEQTGYAEMSIEAAEARTEKSYRENLY